MPETKSPLKNYVRALLFILVVGLAVYLVVKNIDKFGYVLLVALGFGAVILVHEFGHFVIAKLSDIKVEAFSIGFSPVLVGLKKTEGGLRIRILPGLFRQENGPDDGGLLSFTVGGTCKPGETEYRIGLLPFGGFVKMLGQDDTGKAEKTDDPRSFTNKPILARIAVVAAGVVFNALSAVIVFVIVFLIGIELAPAVVGGVVPNSPAELAGLRPGDRIVEIDGETDLDFGNIVLAAAFSDNNEKVSFKVRHEDGSVENIAVAAKKPAGQKLKIFGIQKAILPEIESVSDPKALLEKTGLLPGDRIYAANGRQVRSGWQLEEIIQNSLTPQAILSAVRTDPETNQKTHIQAEVPLNTVPINYNFTADYELAHICSIVPRLYISAVGEKKPSLIDTLLAKVGLKKIDPAEYKLPFKPGDIIITAGDVTNPTRRELQTVTAEYEDKELPVTVLRPGRDQSLETLTLITIPKRRRESEPVLIGIIPMLDVEHPVVAKTIPIENGPDALEIPSGATITRVDGTKVSSFYDVIRLIHQNRGQRISIDYRVSDQVAGSVALDVPADKDFITAKSTFAQPVPFKELKELYKAAGPINAVVLGCKKTVMFIDNAYLTIKGLILGLIGPEALMGPVAILTLSYRIVVEQPTIYYFYFLAVISSIIAVMNLLPLPILDGGVIMLLVVEKVKGSPLSQRAQTVLAYTGIILIGALLLYVTRNDIINFLLK